MKIDVYDWPCGYGKTTAVIEKILTTPARYLLAVPRLDDITERRCDITRMALEMGFRLPTIDEIRSADGGGTRGVENVRRAISMAPSNCSQREHAIVICSPSIFGFDGIYAGIR